MKPAVLKLINDLYLIPHAAYSKVSEVPNAKAMLHIKCKMHSPNPSANVYEVSNK
jgi:hypothetical protein